MSVSTPKARRARPRAVTAMTGLSGLGARAHVADLQDGSGQVALAAGQHDAGLRSRVGPYFIDDEAATRSCRG